MKAVLIPFLFMANALTAQNSNRKTNPIMDSLVESYITYYKGIKEEIKSREYQPSAHLARLTNLPITELKDNIIFIHFWFASCAPCIMEFKGLDQMYRALKSNSNFKFISFTYEDSATIASFQKKYNLAFPISTISNKECDSLKIIPGYPVNILLEKGLIVNDCFYGGLGTEEMTTKFIIENISTKIGVLLQKK